ncbi:MAG: ribonuclease J [Candidatus Sericytochromatia bacterium]
MSDLFDPHGPATDDPDQGAGHGGHPRTPGPDDGRIQIIPLGGLGEIGKNMWCIRSGDSIIVLDCGFGFPSEEMYGVDVVLPDYSYLLANASKVKGVFLSHGHEDHIGGLPFLLKQLNVPLYSTPLTLSLIEGKLQEHGLLGKVALHRMQARDKVTVGDFEVEFIRVCHSIADAVAIAVHTPIGTVLYTGDFKFDPTPIDGQTTDYYKLTELGEKGLLCLLSDSTNATKKGFTPSEASVAPALDTAFHQAKGRIMVTTFASNIHRVQQVLNAAVRHERRVLLLGRSMLNVTQRAHNLGYLKYPEGLLLSLEEAKVMPDEEVVILMTGSQGEPMAALSRITHGDHKGFSVREGDTVLISATPIPGNERAVGRIINQLFQKGANVIYESVLSGTHVSGHGAQEELKQMLAFTKPKFFVPAHGETRHLRQHARLATEMGVSPDHIKVCRNGDVIELSTDSIAVVDEVPGGPVLVDGNVLWDVGQALLRDRQKLARDGVVTTVVSITESLEVFDGPEMVTKGFIYAADAQMILDEGKRRVVEVLDTAKERGITEPDRLKKMISDALSRYFSERTRRKPVQLVVLQVVGPHHLLTVESEAEVEAEEFSGR